jgi:hypothetical protein
MVVNQVSLEACGHILCGRDSRAPWQWLEDLLGANGTDELLHLAARCGYASLACCNEQLVCPRVAQLLGQLPKVIHLVDMQI